MEIRPSVAALQRLNGKHRAARGIDQLIGLCQGVLADGYVAPEEAQMLYAWMKANRDISNEWPASVLYQQIEAAFIDGVLTSDEQRELLRTLMELTGGITPQQGTNSTVTDLPLDRPAPPIQFAGRSFALTGEFYTGRRADIIEVIEALGGGVLSAVLKTTDYLVIGARGSENWRHASFGSKIAAAMKWREKGCEIVIVGEAHWVRCAQGLGAALS